MNKIILVLTHMYTIHNIYLHILCILYFFVDYTYTVIIRTENLTEFEIYL